MKIRIYATIIIAIFIAIWWELSNDLVPSPYEVFETIIELAFSGQLIDNIKASMYRYVIGFSIGAFLGIGTGFIFSLNATLSKSIDPLIQILRPISPISWFPIIVLVFGIGNISAIYIIAYSIFFPLFLLTVSSIHQIDKIYFEAARNFGASRFKIFVNITLPGSFIGIGSALKLAASLAWINLVVGEMVGSQSGLGYLIIDFRNLIMTDGIIASMIIIGLIGYVINIIFEMIEKRIKKKLGAFNEHY